MPGYADRAGVDAPGRAVRWGPGPTAQLATPVPRTGREVIHLGVAAGPVRDRDSNKEW